MIKSSNLRGWNLLINDIVAQQLSNLIIQDITTEKTPIVSSKNDSNKIVLHNFSNLVFKILFQIQYQQIHKLNLPALTPSNTYLITLLLTEWKHSLNSCVPNTPFLYPLKTSESLMIFWCFQEVKKGVLGTNGFGLRKQCHLPMQQNVIYIITIAINS